MDLFLPAFASLIVVAGPWKAAIVFAEKTVTMTRQVRRRVAVATVAIAAAVAIVILLFGVALVELFHINEPAFLIATGAIVFVFALRMVIGEEEPDLGKFEAQEEEEALRIAAYPLAVPILITPPAVAALVAIGIAATAQEVGLVGAVLALGVVMLIDLAVFLILSHYEHWIPTLAWNVAGRVLGIFLAGFGVAVIIDGLKLLGIVS